MDKPRHITLCGMMGSGKSSIGRLLSHRIRRPFFDLDQVIEITERKQITQIFSDHGEGYFRTLERQYLEELMLGKPAVIALGGGALQNEAMLNKVKAKSLLVYLDVPLSAILTRLRRDRSRPLLLNEDGTMRGKEDLKAYLSDLHDQRAEMYKKADIHLKVDPAWNKSKIVEKILENV